MDAGTVTLVIYLAGMGPAPRDLDRVWPYFVMFPKMTLHHTDVPLHHPLGIKLRSMQACLRVAESERARGNKAACEQEHRATGPRDWWPERPPPA
jgi:hypothetical protein